MIQIFNQFDISDLQRNNSLVYDSHPIGQLIQIFLLMIFRILSFSIRLIVFIAVSTWIPVRECRLCRVKRI